LQYTYHKGLAKFPSELHDKRLLLAGTALLGLADISDLPLARPLDTVIRSRIA